MKIINTVFDSIREIKFKPLLLKGIRVGLFAFVASFVISIIVSVVFNILFLKNVSEVIQGSIGSSDSVTLSGIIKMTSFVMNISVFNRVAELKFGVLIFAIIPFLSFYIANRQDNKHEGFNFNHIVVYAISSVIYGFLVVFEAFISKGELIGTQINFFTFSNFLSTLIIAFFLQLIIGFNYDAHGMSGIRATRFLLRVLLSLALVVSVAGLIYFLKDYELPIIYIIISIVVLVPNLIIYGMFMMMGVSIGLSDSLVKVLTEFNLDISFQGLPVGVKLIVLAVFAIIVMLAANQLNKDHYIKRLAAFAFSFSLFSFFAAYCTTLKLGTIVFLEDVYIGVRLLPAILMTFASIFALGLILKLVKDVIAVVLEK